MARRGLGMWIAVLVGLLIAWGLMVLGVGFPKERRAAGPRVEGRVEIIRELPRATTINPSPGMGHLMVQHEMELWVLYLLTDGTVSNLAITYSADGGEHWTSRGPITLDDPAIRLLQPALVRDRSGALIAAVQLHGPADRLEALAQGRPLPPADAPQPHSPTAAPSGLTGIALFRSDDGGGNWNLLGRPVIADSNTSFSAPIPLIGNDGSVVCLYRQTTDKKSDEIWCVILPPRVSDQPRVRVDDDPTGSHKTGFTAGYLKGRLHVAYTDGRSKLGKSSHLRYTWTDVPTLGFKPSRPLDLPQANYWQVPPDITTTASGRLLVSSTTLTEQYLPLNYQEKLKRHRVGGLYQVTAYSREPVVWLSEDNGETFALIAGIDDQPVEVSTGGVHTVEREGQIAVLWAENRPVYQPADLRWSFLGGLGERFTASVVVNPTPGDTAGEVLYDVAWLPDGRLAVLYKDRLDGGSTASALFLAHSAPLGERAP